MKTTITLQEYLSKGKTFVIPDYQRGYIWGQEGRSKTKAVEWLSRNLVGDIFIIVLFFFPLYYGREISLSVSRVSSSQRSPSVFFNS